MTRLSIVALGLLLAVGCSSNSTTPSNSTAGTTTTRFTAALAASSESPAIVGAEASGAGTSTMDFNITRDATGAITAASVNFSVTMQNLAGTSVVNIAHIHQGATGVNGPIVVNTTVNPGEVVLSGGAGTFTRVGLTMTAALAQSILDNPAGFYFNIHTAANPAGVMRGQLVKQ